MFLELQTFLRIWQKPSLQKKCAYTHNVHLHIKYYM